jgi:moderate conductance mechanosensitive channel
VQTLLDNWTSDLSTWVRHQAVPDLLRIIAILIIAMVLLRMLRGATRRLADYSRHQPALPTGIRVQQLRTLSGVINSVGGAVIVFFAVIEILNTMRIAVGPLIASAGIVGLAIGFGAQTLVRDVINGFFILMENQYDLGDIVRIAGVKGTVENMTLRKTVLRDQDGSLHFVPNSEIKIVSNLTRDWSQLALHVNVAYDESSDRVLAVLREAANEVRHDPEFTDAIVGDPEVPGIERVTGGEVDYLMLVKTRPADQLRVGRELRRRIKECLEKNNIRPARPAQFVVAEPVQPTQ